MMSSELTVPSCVLPHPQMARSRRTNRMEAIFVSWFCTLILLLAPAMLGAEDLQVVAKKYCLTFSASHPVLLRIKPGDVVTTKTVDCFGLDEHGEVASPPGNPLTGPFYVEGAEAGDALRVHLRKLQMNRPWGASYYRMGLLAVTPESILKMHSDQLYPDLVIKGYANLVRWDIDLAKSRVQLRDPVSGQRSLEFAAHPMLGCIGVAPGGEFTPTNETSGPYGGNLDYNEIREGAAVLLPVHHAGAYFYLGDAHALQGDGEAIGSGIETSMAVEFSVDLFKKAHLTGPRLETPDDLISVGAQPEFRSDLNLALQAATTDMLRWLTEEYKMKSLEAQELLSFQAKYDVITVAGSVGLKIPRRCLPPHP
jgi:amidase